MEKENLTIDTIKSLYKDILILNIIGLINWFAFLYFDLGVSAVFMLYFFLCYLILFILDVAGLIYGIINVFYYKKNPNKQESKENKKLIIFAFISILSFLAFFVIVALTIIFNPFLIGLLNTCLII